MINTLIYFGLAHRWFVKVKKNDIKGYQKLTLDQLTPDLKDHINNYIY